MTQVQGQSPGSKRHIAVLLGTLKKDSFNRRIAETLAELAPPDLCLEVVDISRLAVYEQHAQTTRTPPEWTLFREQILAADGLLIMVPEGGRRVPNVLRNALAIASQPQERNAWAGKPCGVVSVSHRGILRGTADRRLRRDLLSRHVPVMEQVDSRPAWGQLQFDADGQLASREVKRFLEHYVHDFSQWVQHRYLH